MTPSTKPSPAGSDSALAAAAASNDSVAARGKLTPLRPVNLVAPLAADRATDDKLLEGGRSSAAGRVYQSFKRVFDLAGGLALLLIASPVILIAALFIRLETKGSPFFIQTRLGEGGKPFKIFKLRGMFIDARERFASYYDYSQHRDLEFCFHHEQDPRVTRAGKLIRKTSIDELPNLWNVVVGDMSLVGPRPEIPEVLALYGPYRDEYLSVKPGITCLSKVTGRDRLTKKETIHFDLNYIRKQSFSLDLQILWRTFRGVVLRRDVF